MRGLRGIGIGRAILWEIITLFDGVKGLAEFVPEDFKASTATYQPKRDLP